MIDRTFVEVALLAMGRILYLLVPQTQGRNVMIFDGELWGPKGEAIWSESGNLGDGGILTKHVMCCGFV